MDTNFLKKDFIGYKVFKNILDLITAFLLIVVTLPLQLLIAIIIFLELKENPIFIQERGLTFSNQKFKIVKFRTIKSIEIERKQSIYSKDIFLQPGNNFEFTPFTKLLRKIGLDELPQLYNILFGSMNFIGPRPLMLKDIEVMEKEFPKEYKLRDKLKSKPGISGVWQIFGDRKLGIGNLIELDSYYEHNKSFILDLKLVVNTLLILIFVKEPDSILHRLHFFDKLYSYISFSGSYKIEHGEITVIDKHKKTKSYKINLPAKWWYVTNSYGNPNEPFQEKNLFIISRKNKSA